MPLTALALVLPLAIAHAPAVEAPPAAKDTGLTGILSEEAFKALHDLKGEAAPALRGTAVDLAGGKAYLSLPEGALAPLPGIIVVHEWWGLNDHVRHWTDRLAEGGYAALAVDLYDGKVATTRDEAMAQMKAVQDERASLILAAAHAFLVNDARVKAPRTASIGWCFGGGWSLRTALAQPELDACVVYYGRVETDPAALRKIRASVLGVFGDKDLGIPPETVAAIEKGLREAGVEARILRYDAEHAFANPSNPRYDATSAGAAWAEVRAFLAARLRPRSKE